jgi:hypothetical protein
MNPAKYNKQQHETIRLNSHDSKIFIGAWLKPVRFNQKLLDAFDEYDERVTPSCSIGTDRQPTYARLK